jgi:hypothetical protein
MNASTLLFGSAVFLIFGSAAILNVAPSVPAGVDAQAGMETPIFSKGAIVLQTPGPLGAAPQGPYGAAIAAAATGFVGTPTSGLRGAAGDVACMASVQYLVQSATGHDLGDGPLANDVDAGLQLGLNDGTIVEIRRADAEPGDLEAVFSLDDPNEQHIGVCESAACATNLSNASSTMTFGWSSTDFQYAGGPYAAPPHAIELRFFRIVR